MLALCILETKPKLRFFLLTGSEKYIDMAHPAEHGFCTNGVVRLVYVLAAVCLIGYTTTRPSSNLSSKEEALCSQCSCDCPKDFDSVPADIINSPFLDCGKHEPEMKEEMEKDIVALISEELSLQQTVARETLRHADALLMDARKTSSHYQKEAEKCNAGVEICEEARERAEAELAEEIKVSEVWELRAQELGWKYERSYT